jgi:hypothetical protein
MIKWRHCSVGSCRILGNIALLDWSFQRCLMMRNPLYVWFREISPCTTDRRHSTVRAFIRTLQICFAFLRLKNVVLSGLGLTLHFRERTIMIVCDRAYNEFLTGVIFALII